MPTPTTGVALDTSITLTLSGDVPLPLFITALQGLNDLLRAASEEVGAPSIDWIVQDLAVGSTIATVSGAGESPDVIAQATGIAILAAMAVEERRPQDFSLPIQAATRQLTSVLNGVVSDLTLVSGNEAVVITSADLADDATTETSPRQLGSQTVSAFGSVTGVVQVLSHARRLEFSVRDERSGRLVRTKANAELAEDLRTVWDKRSVVEGIVTRDRASGDPLGLSEVTRVTLARDVPSGTFLMARGALRPTADAEPPEVTIRRMRDAS